MSGIVLKTKQMDGVQNLHSLENQFRRSVSDELGFWKEKTEDQK